MENRRDPKSLLLRSRTARREGRYEEALQCLNELMATSTVPCHLSRARVLVELGRYEEAFADCNEVFRIAGPIPELQEIRETIGNRALAHYALLLSDKPHAKESARAKEQASVLLRWPRSARGG